MMSLPRLVYHFAKLDERPERIEPLNREFCYPYS
jgi:hypothetical protein